MTTITIAPGFEPVRTEIDAAVAAAREILGEDLLAVVVYGSWARGEGRAASDIDISAVCACKVAAALETRLRTRLWDLLPSGARDSFVHPVALEDFINETMPFFTSQKRDGVIVWGAVDLQESTNPYHLRYAGFFLESWKWEGSRVGFARRVLCGSEVKGFEVKERGYSGVIRILVLEPCAIAAKHCVQINLQMRGLGFTSGWTELERLCRSEFGERIADAFARLSARFLDHELEPTLEESAADVQDAETVHRLYAETARRFSLPLPDSNSKEE